MALVVTSLMLILSTGAWSLAVALDLPGVSDVGLVMISMSLWTATIASVAGMIVNRSRWARRLGLALTGAHALMAVVRPVDGWWIGAVALSVAGAVAVGGPWLTGIVRSLPSAAGPPARAVLLPLLLVAVPFLLGMVGAAGVTPAVVGLGSLAAAYWFIRTLPGALWVVRLLWPTLALALAWPMGGWTGTVAALAAIGVGAVAWHPSVARAVSPLVERGSVVPIPPELAPRDVLDAAGVDERGRPR